MNIYQLNYLTKTNILLYQEEDPLFIFYRLLKDNVHDAIIVYDVYKWKRIYCTSIPFLNWIKGDIELTPPAIKELLKNGDKEVLDYIDPADYVYFILLSNSSFIKYILDNYSITIEDYHLIELVKEADIDKYNTFKTILDYSKISINIVMDCLYYLCQYDEVLLVKHLFMLYPMIIKSYSLKPLFYKTLTYNHLELSLYFLELDPTLLHNIDSILLQLFINHSYKTLNLLYILNPQLFSNINHNYIFAIISANKNIVPEFVNWYLSRFRVRIDNNLYEENIKKLMFNGYCIGTITDDFFIHACTQNYIHIVKQYNYNYFIIEQGFGIAALFGYLDIVQYLCPYIEKTMLYKILHNLIEMDTIHNAVVKYISSQIDIHPPKLIQYLCKIGDIDISKDLDEECILILCLNGHFSLFYELYVNCRIEQHTISNAFIHACENGKGLFLAKWLYYTNYLSKNIIQCAFYNSYDIHTLKWLYSIEYIPIRKNNSYFIERCLNYDLVILDWLCELFPNYSYCIVDGVLEYKIDLYKVLTHIEKKECCICLETNSNSMTLCKHDFCYNCINEWYKKNNSCPMCREKMEEVYFSSPLNELILH
jgi:hypothetical protein